MASVEKPIYEPDKWNKPGVQNSHNCYDYAVDDRQRRPAGHKSQPGKKKNKEANDPGDCAKVAAAAKEDGLVASTKDAVCEGTCWKVTLVVDPKKVAEGGKGYHWYRQDENGKWSHKPGEDPATNLDANGKEITDPERADRGNYSKFCNLWFCVCRENVQVAGLMPKPTDAVTASVLLFAGMDDPGWRLSKSEIAILTAKIARLPPAEPSNLSTFGFHGFLILNPSGSAELPQAIRVAHGVVTLMKARGKATYHADAYNLEAWLLSRALKQKFSGVVESVLAAETATKPTKKRG
jgi:hypothetical protein